MALLLASGALLPFHPAAAQADAAPPPADEPAAGARDPHVEDDFHTIYVTTAGLDRLDLLAGTTALSGEELQRSMAGQIGDVLDSLPGVSSTSFAPGASRPVLRGFAGDRVRVLTDGIGAIDASNTSADHAVTIDPLTAERIEVLRGPAVLLYGGSAIGGAVNVLDKRIPRQVPDETVHVDVIASADTAFDLREAGGSVDIPLGSELVLHADATWRETGNVEIPGFAVAEELRTVLLADAAEHEADSEPEEAEELREAANRRGTVPGTDTETLSLGGGLAWIGEGASLGVSVGYYDTLYGIPERPGASHLHVEHDDGDDHEDEDDHEEAGHAHGEGVAIDLEQLRFDLRGSVELGDGFLSELRTRWGYSAYTHTELEGGEIGTVFDVTGLEGRVDLVQARRGGWSGSFGGQFVHRDFSATGAEAFVAPNTTRQLAVFTVQEFNLGAVNLQLGGRYEHGEVESDVLGISRDFDTLTGAIGASVEIAGGMELGANLSRSARAPTAEELFADGPHIATQQYEIGDPDLEAETAIGAELYLRGNIGPAELRLTFYRNWFDGFIAPFPDGTEQDELPVYRILQADADHYGIEGELSVPLWQDGNRTLLADIGGDYVHAELDDGTPLPLMPPLRLMGGLEWQSAVVDARAEIEWNDAQTRAAPFETPTDGFTMVNASIAFKPLRGSNNVTVLLQADNIFDVEARRHASYTKDFVPHAGRNFKLGVRASY